MNFQDLTKRIDDLKASLRTARTVEDHARILHDLDRAFRMYGNALASQLTAARRRAVTARTLAPVLR